MSGPNGYTLAQVLHVERGGRHAKFTVQSGDFVEIKNQGKLVVAAVGFKDRFNGTRRFFVYAAIKLKPAPVLKWFEVKRIVRSAGKADAGMLQGLAQLQTVQVLFSSQAHRRSSLTLAHALSLSRTHLPTVVG